MPLNRHVLFPLLVAFLALSPALAGCQSQSTEPQLHDGLLMAHLSTMPAEVQAAADRTREAYQFAVANPDILRELPCYCGCGPIGHKNNYDCYVADPGENGAFTYDPHALGCTVCVDITQDAMWLLRQGKTAPEIRAYIDRNFERYGPSNMP